MSISTLRTMYCKARNIRGCKILQFFYFELFAGGIFCGFLVKWASWGKEVCGMMNLRSLVNCKTRENFFHVKISCFTVS